MEPVCNVTESCIDAALYRYYSIVSSHDHDLDHDIEPDADVVLELIKRPTTITLDDVEARLARVKNYRAQLKKLLTMPQVEQRSPEWYEMRRGRLTASAISQSIGKGKFATRNALLKSKAFPEHDKVFDSHKCAPLRHGIILEDMTARCYAQRRNNVKIHNFGMIPHPTLSCFGASPDGINDLGIMIEIKTPYSRKVGGAIPNEYMLQMQGQMAVCGLSECDFVDAEIVMNPNIDMYLSDHDISADATTDHGIILEYFTVQGERRFDYSPPYMTPQQCFEWAMQKKKERSAEHGLENMLLLQAWRLVKLHVDRVMFDSALWDGLVPGIRAFWDDVIALRGTSSQPSISDTKEKTKTKTHTKRVLQVDLDETDSPTKYAFIESDDED